MEYYVAFIVLVALAFDVSNGFNDAANSIATVVATRVLSPRKAVLWAAFFNFIAAFMFSTHVARTISRDLVDPGLIDPHVILITLISAITWTVFCTFKGLPISVSHSLIGSLAGAVICKAGFHALVWSKIGKIAAFIVISPMVGLMIGFTLMVAVNWICHLLRVRPRSVDSTFRVLQLVSAAVYSLSHGLNDAQKTMGIITVLLLSVPSMAHLATHSGNPEDTELAWWIILSCHGCIALGTYLGGWKVISTLGHKVTKLLPVHGFCAETGGGASIILWSYLGIPVSTTHTITGAIFGVGLTRSLNQVRWAVGREIFIAWVLTLPTTGILSALMFWGFSQFAYKIMPF